MEWYEISAYVTGLFLGVVALIMDLNNKKLKKVSTEKETLLKLIETIIPKGIEYSENSGLIGADEKKTYALSTIVMLCEKEKIKFSDYSAFIDVALEKLIEFSKKINAREDDEDEIMRL